MKTPQLFRDSKIDADTCRRYKILVAYARNPDYRAAGTNIVLAKDGIAYLRHAENNFIIVSTNTSSLWDGEHPYSGQFIV